MWGYTLARHATSQHIRESRRRRARESPLSRAGPLSEIEERIRTATLTSAGTASKTRIAELRERLPAGDQTLFVLRINRRLTVQGRTSLYLPSKRDAIAKLADPGAACIYDAPEGFSARATEQLTALGAMTSDFFDPDFLASVGLCGITGDPNGSTEPAATWERRFRADRPRSDPQGGDILFWQGGQDTLATPPFAQCGIDKITSDFQAPGATARLSVCGDRTADHDAVLRNVPWIARWIASRTVGAPKPDPCPGIEALQPEEGGALACPDVPGNAD